MLRLIHRPIVILGFASAIAVLCGSPELWSQATQPAPGATPPAVPATPPPVAAAIDSLALPNGLRILVQTDPAQSRLSAGLWVGAGWVHNPRGKEGLADLAAAVDLRRGRAAITAGRAGKPEMLGDLQMNVATDHTFFTAAGAAGDLGPVLSALAAVLPAAGESFDAASAMKEEALTNLLRTRRASGLVAREAMSVALFGDRRPLGRSARFQTLLGVLPEDVARFHSDYYHPSNSALVVGGPITAA